MWKLTIWRENLSLVGENPRLVYGNLSLVRENLGLVCGNLSLVRENLGLVCRNLGLVCENPRFQFKSLHFVYKIYQDYGLLNQYTAEIVLVINFALNTVRFYSFTLKSYLHSCLFKIEVIKK